MHRFKYKLEAQASGREILGNIPSLARFEVAHLRQDFAFQLIKHVKIKKAKRSNTSPTRKRGSRKSWEISARLRFGLVFVQLQNLRVGLVLGGL